MLLLPAREAAPREANTAYRLEMSSAEVSKIYTPPSLDVAYKQTLSFVDPNPTTGQVFPRFEVSVPKLDER